MTDTPCPLAHSIDGAAALLDCSRGHIYNLISAGELERIKLGKSARVTHRSILALIDRKAGEAQKAAA